MNNKVLNSSFFIFAYGGFLGSLFFLCFFGTNILDFTYTDWLMTGGDLSPHYLGWRFFRNSSWYFPFGLIDNIVYPFKVSVIYTDSIPLFAVFFKLLSPILPENFQYFGLFGIMCYALQGGIGALIIKKIGGNTGQSITGSLFFTFSTVMIWRLYIHTSLAAHFIILLCILVYLQYDTYSFKKQIFSWAWLLALSVSIHLYFVPMVMIFMFFCLLQKCVLTKNYRNQCIVFGVSLFVLIGTMFFLGAFNFISDVNQMSVNDASEQGLGFYSANLNALVNPQGISLFLRDMPVADGQYEGNAYLGLGIILSCFIIAICLFREKTDLMSVRKIKLFPFVTGIILSFLLFSLSPTVTFNQYTLFTYPVPGFIKIPWSFFRSSGRIIWPVVYIVITICTWWIIMRFSKRKSIALLCVLLLVQWIDLKPWFTWKGNIWKTKYTWENELTSPVWDNLANDYKHIFFVTDLPRTRRVLSYFDFAVNYRLTLNDAIVFRKNTVLINEDRQKEIINLMNGISKNDTIYLFPGDNNDVKEIISLLKAKSLHFFIVDDVIIGINSRKNYLDSYGY